MATRQKKTNYFSHDSNARNDERIVSLRMTQGAAGYGVYFMILERLREEKDYMSAKDYNMIAFDLRVDVAVVKSVIEDFGLFDFTDDGKYFYSESFTRRMLIKDTIKKKRSEGGKAGMKKRWNKAVIKEKQKEDNDQKQPSAGQPKEEAAYLKRFFSKANSANLEVLLINFGLNPNDLPKLKKSAKDVIYEWRITGKTHKDYTDWSQHLISTMRIKLKGLQKETATDARIVKPPEAADYKYDGGFGSKDV